MEKKNKTQGFKVELKIRDMDRGDRGDMGGGQGKHDKNKKSFLRRGDGHGRDKELDRKRHRKK